MSGRTVMCDKELLIGYLYDDIGDAERLAFEAHLSSCLDCRNELAALRETRAALVSWTPAGAQLGFQIVRRSQASESRTPGWLSGFRPALGLAAAAALVLAAAAAIANLDVRYGADGLTVRTGWAPAATEKPVGSASGAAAAPITAAEFTRVKDRLTALEASVRAAAARQAPTENAAVKAKAGRDVMREARLLISQSEARQQGELALRLNQVIRDFERQRRIDLATVQQSLQNATGADAVVHRQMMDYFVRVSQVK